MASSTRTGAVYGIGAYGAAQYGISNVSTVVDGVQSVGTTDPDIVISGDSLHSIASVQGVVTNGGVGQIVANATAEPTGVSTTPTVNATLSFIGDANFTLPESAVGTSQIGTAQGRPSTVILSSDYGGGFEITTTVNDTLVVLGKVGADPESVSSTFSVTVPTISGDGILTIPEGAEGQTQVTAASPAANSVTVSPSVSASFSISTEYTDKYDGFTVTGSSTNAIYGEGVYGQSRYGLVASDVFHEVSAVDATGAVGNVSISADNNTSISAGVFAEIITDAVAVVGDEVTIVAGADVDTTGVEGTSTVGTILTQTTNVFEVVSVSATGSVGDVTVVAEANTSVTGVLGTSALEDVTTTADSNFEVAGVSATGTVDENEVVLNNARPTFDSVTATGSAGDVNVITVRNVFQSANRIEARTVYVKAETPTVVYIPADKNRTVYVKAA